MRFDLLLCISSMLVACGAPGTQTPSSSRGATPAGTAITPEQQSRPVLNTCATRMNRYGFPPGEHAHALQSNLATQAPDVQFIAMETTSEDTPAKRSMSLDPNKNDSYSEHFVLLCDDGDTEINDPAATMENPAWLAELQKVYSSCKVARAFGPNVKEIRYTQTCGKAIHLRKPIPKLLAIEEKKVQALLEKERKERDKEYRASLVEQCGVGHVSSCEKKGCMPVPPAIEPYCPGGKRLSDEERMEQERLRDRNPPKPKCGCLCGKIVAAPQSKACLPRP